MIRFYSLLQVFTKKLIQKQFHYVLIDVLDINLQYNYKTLENKGINIFHERLMISTLIILNRMLSLPQSVVEVENSSSSLHT